MPDAATMATAFATPPSPTPEATSTHTLAPEPTDDSTTGAIATTPTPTLNPTSTPTTTPVAPSISPTETATPAPTETPLSPGWHVRGVTAYQDGDGNAHVLGVVLNNTGEDQESVTVLVDLYGDDDRRLDTTQAWTTVMVLPQGVSVPFRGVSSLRSKLAGFGFAGVEAEPSDLEARQDLVLVQESALSGNPYVVTGVLGNAGPDLPPDGCGQVIAILYDGADTVSGWDFDVIPGSALKTNQQAPFEVTILDPLPGTVRYELVVIGYEAGCGE